MRVAAGLLVLTAVSVALRTGALDAGYWIDEAIAVGIASHEPGEIPALLRQDGSPPLYYLLLHAWIGMFGSGEAATRSLSLLFAALAVPAAWWAGTGGDRAGAVAAVIVAVSPSSATTRRRRGCTRSWPPVAGRGRRLRASGGPSSRRRARPAALHAHVGRLPGRRPRARVAGAAPRPWRGVTFAVVALLYLPWLPSLVFQALHTGAPWSAPPSVLYLVPAALAVAWRPRDELVLAGAAGVRARVARLAGRARVVGALRRGLPRAGAAGPRAPPTWAVAVLLAASLLAGLPDRQEQRPGRRRSVAQSVRPGDLVVVTQPEQVPVLYRYLPAGVRYLTPLGAPADPSMTDWRDALPRLRAAGPNARWPSCSGAWRRAAGRPRQAGRAPGASPWARAVRRPHARVARRAPNEPRLRPIGATSQPDPTRFRSTIRAEIFEVVSP